MPTGVRYRILSNNMDLSDLAVIRFIHSPQTQFRSAVYITHTHTHTFDSSKQSDADAQSVTLTNSRMKTTRAAKGTTHVAPTATVSYQKKL